VKYQPFAWCTEAKVTALEQYALPMLRLPKRGTAVEFATKPNVTNIFSCQDKLFTPPEFHLELRLSISLSLSFIQAFKAKEQQLITDLFPNVPHKDLHISHRGDWETVLRAPGGMLCMLLVSVAHILQDKD
jgi:hypothetical protein